MMVSIGIAIGLTDWQRGWPLQRVGWLGRMDSLMLATVTTMLSLAASFQLSLYCLRSMLITYWFQPAFRKMAIDAEIKWYQDDWQQDPWDQKYRD